MEHQQPEGMTSLEQIRAATGNDACIRAFDEKKRQNSEAALTQLNAQETTFPTLYLLAPGIGDLANRLSERNLIAIGIVAELTRSAGEPLMDLSSPNQSVHTTLLWMLHTGYTEHALDEPYQKVMDLVCSILLDIDKSILPQVCALIFERKKRGQCIHDLVWAFFRTKDAAALRLLAERLDSEEKAEHALARSLLHMNEGGNGDTAPQTDRAGYGEWLNEVEPFLFFTGLGHQFSSSPVMWGVDYAKKDAWETGGSEARR